MALPDTADYWSNRPSKPLVIPRRRRFVSVDEMRAYGFIIPLVVLEILFVVTPLVIGFYYSLYRVDYFELTSFRGSDNYWRVLTSSMVLQSLAATAIFAIGALVLTLSVGMGLALYLEQDTRWNIFSRAAALVPYVISMLVGSLLLRWIFSTDSGLVAATLGPFGLGDATILADPRAAMGALIFNAGWRDSAFAMILLLAGLKSIPPQLHAAARVDGASTWYRFRHITLPLMRIPILIAVVRLLIHFVNVLTFALVLTGGGPNGATQTMGLAMYRLGFLDARIGEANALAILVFLFNIVLIGINVALFSERRRSAS
ncbi:MULTISPECIES: sugar ABC transporter permease [unclassified Chelatococcus]|uniref:carbohydrate ABC transporter permease n=1 Tax=unclassified Chelatococcus TaxID=2638111 RepID=UPI001BCF188E|nr:MULTISPECIES: sugar ABC transporter permease [unclassified Chelatococcus]CAH1656330.1 Multiple sugar transport system permease protein [Hyphomicrobiales bacterium]MBS7742471.1 sugar ABC transporter permease [Chelatococcus sp. HY11]MBX3542411.1 sugar ABC transporter permease [Chelatococcus sp.]MCO5075372.1 sugar ABC transporter permease [Chelatococcus sp.]CAH1695813.1 Multiple sugar transport system permease protein [Hyphomicrobiales bacterium]